MNKFLSALTLSTAAFALSACTNGQPTSPVTITQTVPAPATTPAPVQTVTKTATETVTVTPTATVEPEMPDYKNGIDREGTRCKPEYINANGLCSPWIEKQMKDAEAQKRCEANNMTMKDGKCVEPEPTDEEKAQDCADEGGVFKNGMCDIPDTSATPQNSLIAPDPSETVQPPKTSNLTETPAPKVSYASCSEAEDAGVAPIRKGEPGYSKRLDRDGDGVACDQ